MGEHADGIFTCLNHPFVRRTTLEKKEQPFAFHILAVDGTIETVEQISDGTTQIVPIDGRADHDCVCLFHGFKHLVEFIVIKFLTVAVDLVIHQVDRLVHPSV